MIRWLLLSRMHLRFNAAKDGQKYADKMNYMLNYRKQIDQYLRATKGKISPKEKTKLLKIKKRLPIDTLLDRIKLMEVTELFNYPEPKDFHGSWNGKCLNKVIKRMNFNVKKLKRIDDKMMSLISDIHDLYSYIEYVKNANASNVKEISLMKQVSWSNRKHERNIPDMSKIHKWHNIPNLVPDMYGYLEA
ncbi:hypothetical protein ACLKA6_014170 [Drosophila palustris]